MNTKHPPPPQEEAPAPSYQAPVDLGEYKIVRCFQVPTTFRCYRSSKGAAWERCETVMERQCYLYTYTINTDQ